MEKGRIIKEAHPLLVASINKYGKSKDEFEDLYQEGVVRILELLEEFDESKGVNLFYYLKLNLKFFYLNYGRYEKKTISLNTPAAEGVELWELIEDDSPGVEDIVVGNMVANDIYKAIDKLNKEEKYIIEELFIKSRTLDALAKELKISRTTLFRKKESIIKKVKMHSIL